MDTKLTSRFLGTHQNSWSFVVLTSLLAFLTYASMYAFRKPLSAATYEGLFVFGLNYKVVLVITQVLGYLTSKFIGIKIIAELKRTQRFWLLIGLILFSELALLLFAVTPYPYNFVWVFFNGLPLGLIWGIVFSYLEGRKFTDVLATFLCISFIVSSGVVKSVGRILIENYGVSDFWMPVTVGLLFFPLLLLTSYLLNKVPHPNEQDIQIRVERKPLNAKERGTLFKKYAVGLSFILFVNLVLTIIRDIKDNFMVEIWQSLLSDISPFIYFKIETFVGIVVLLLLAFMYRVKDNVKAFSLIHFSMLIGLVVVLVTTWLFHIKWIGAFTWMVFNGIGLYLSYITFQSLYFERFLAVFKEEANVGFFIYISDFIGYVGSCVLLIF